MSIITKSTALARESVEAKHTHLQYVRHVQSLNLIEYIEILILDSDAYDRIWHIVHTRKYY